MSATESARAEALAVLPDDGFLRLVEARSHEPVSRCYQCRKCTNGCPVAFAMDLRPNQIMRTIQLGLEEETLRSVAIWICAACQTCTTRCPNDIDIAHLMDTLRQLCLEKYPAAEPKVVKFHEAFLDSVRRHGRLFELGMVARYLLAAREPLAHARDGWEMFKRGKLKFLPARVKARAAIRGMFEKPRED